MIAPPLPAAPARRATPALSARVAVYSRPSEPPELSELSEADAGILVERLFESVARWARLPVVAVREIIENLVHAGFRDALVSILADGRVIRVSDSGPGIPDVERAMEPGFTTAGADQRRFVRGVGCGLPLAASLMDAEGGLLELTENLGGGTVVTLSAPVPPDAGGDGADPPPTEDARVVMALLLEIGPSRPDQLAAELGWSVCSCGRELVVLEARGLVNRTDEGLRSLTQVGSTLLATLF